MKSDSTIRRRARALWKIAGNSPDDCEARIAQAMATTLDWARDRYRRGNLPADASELAMYLRNDLERRAVNEPASLPKEGP